MNAPLLPEKKAVRPCPVCRRPADGDAKFLPFCSKRCQQIDLGSWASGEYCVAGEPVESWDLEDGDQKAGL